MQNLYFRKAFATIQIAFHLKLLIFILFIFGFTNAVLTPAFAQVRVHVSIEPAATLLNSGQAVRLNVTVHCSPGNGEVREAFVYITQNGIQSNFARIPVICRGGPNTYQVTVTTSNGETFKSGQAHASAYVLITHPKTGSTTSGQASTAITL
jgi:hypothetical protein